MALSIPEFWSIPVDELLQQLQTSPDGLNNEIIKQRQKLYGSSFLKSKSHTSDWRLLLAQFKSPIILILLFAAGLSAFLQDIINTLIILAIVLISGLLGFWQERGATHAVAKLQALVKIKSRVLRNGIEQEVPVEEVLPGDIALLSAGAGIPGDCIILEAKDFYVNEATLTGETYPVDKTASVLPMDTPLGQRKNSLFIGLLCQWEG